jgi:hypothetical protein
MSFTQINPAKKIDLVSTVSCPTGFYSFVHYTGHITEFLQYIGRIFWLCQLNHNGHAAELP